MKVQEKLDEIRSLVEAARSLPMSSSIVINRAELLRLLDELGDLLPDDIAQAEAVLNRRDAMLYEATANAERLLTAAMEERARMVSEEEVLREARIEAGEVLRSAQERSERTSREIDEYVDAKLAHLEVSVTNILETVRQGRQRLAEPGLYGELSTLPEPELAPERPALPQRPKGSWAEPSAALSELAAAPERGDYAGEHRHIEQRRTEQEGFDEPMLGPAPVADGAGENIGAPDDSIEQFVRAGRAPARTGGGWTPQLPQRAAPTDEVSAGDVAEPAAEFAPEFDAESGPEFDAESGPELDAESGPELDAESGPEFDAESGPEFDAESGPESDAESGPESDAEPVGGDGEAADGARNGPPPNTADEPVEESAPEEVRAE